MKLITLLTALLVPGLALGTPVQSAAPGSELEAGLAAGAVDRLMRRGCTSNVRFLHLNQRSTNTLAKLDIFSL
jgi:hypothetical protein